MCTSSVLRLAAVAASLAVAAARAPAQQTALGLFQGEADVGQVTNRGSVTYDAARERYTIAGSGANMWLDHDDFHYLWKRIQGNFLLLARAQFDGPGVEPHRKLGWTIRSDLTRGSAHVTAAVHGDGLAALQVRRTAGGQTAAVRSPGQGPDGTALIYDSGGLLYRFDLADRRPVALNTGFATSNNNDHVLSFDGRTLAISHHSAEDHNASIVYTVPVGGGTPQRVTKFGPSYLHGWSPDGKFLVYTGQRGGEFDVYRIPVDGGEETRLTSAPGLDDGPEYSPDGRYIYFNSVRSGTMQVWRMRADGSAQQQITSDQYNNWFPHVSPDGRWIVFLSFMKDVAPDDHPFYKHVYLRVLPAAGGTPRVVGYVYGGQGTINVPSGSPDSRRVAFVSNTDLRRVP